MSAWNGCFLSLPDNEKGNLYCTNAKAGDREVIQVCDSVIHLQVSKPVTEKYRYVVVLFTYRLASQ